MIFNQKIKDNIKLICKQFIFAFFYYNIYVKLMRKAQENQVVEFSNLTEGHKAEFIQFLIKNNICFQEGKQNCFAKVSIKNQKQTKFKRQNENKPLSETSPNKINKTKIVKNLQNDIKNKPNASTFNHLEIKTPIKINYEKQLQLSALSQNSRHNTVKKSQNKSPKKTTISKDAIAKNRFRSLSQKKKMASNQSIQKQKQRVMKITDSNLTNNISNKKPIEKSRDKVINKYSRLFQLESYKQRAIRWPINLLQKTIEQIYDQIFLKNTQYLQNKNIGTAMKALHQHNFIQLINIFFNKKFKSTKLIASNLNNMLYSLSYFISKQSCPVFLQTFEDFLMKKYQFQDLIFYLFSRSMIKKQLRYYDKTRDIAKSTQRLLLNYVLKVKDLTKFLKCIVGRDSELLNEYKQTLLQKIQSDQIQIYQFLKILLEDYYLKRMKNGIISEQFDSFGYTLRQKDLHSYERKNTQQLTFGEEAEEEEAEQVNKNQQFDQTVHQENNFWRCLDYSHIKDNLFQLVSEKMVKKVDQLLEILYNDRENYKQQSFAQLQKMLNNKAQSLIKAIFQMNKIKWFRELSISNASNDHIDAVQKIQMKLRVLRQNPSGRQIGQFCKDILTTKELVNQIQKSLA